MAGNENEIAKLEHDDTYHVKKTGVWVQDAAGNLVRLNDSGTGLASLYAPITVSSSGATAVVAAVASKKIRVLAYNYMANGTVNVKFQSASIDKTGLAYLVANTGKVAPFSPVGWFETAAGEALNINLSGNVALGGELVYVLI